VFRAKAPLKEVVIEPDSAVVLVEAPVTQMKFMAMIRQMPWTGVGAAALEMYRQAGELKIDDVGTRVKLALLLYDGKYYQESLDLMTQLEKSDWRFAALVWQGHLLDLLGRRDEAVARYQEALKVPGSPNMQHAQYNMRINRAWVDERLKTPFERR
jgi:tetratricopeptide (TPR) repeat protein